MLRKLGFHKADMLAFCHKSSKKPTGRIPFILATASALHCDVREYRPVHRA